MKIFNVKFCSTHIFPNGVEISFTTKDGVRKNNQYSDYFQSAFKIKTGLYSQVLIPIMGINATGKTSLLDLLSLVFEILLKDQKLNSPQIVNVLNKFKVSEKAPLFIESYKKGSTRKVGFPKFKKKSATSGSFYIGGDQVVIKEKQTNCKSKDSNIKVSENKQYLKIPNFGWVKLTEKIRFNGHINSCVISQHGERFYASFNLEISEDEYKRTHKGNEVNTEHTIVGIDVGLKAFITTDAGLFIQAPKPLKRLEQRLKRAQRVLSRRVHPKAKGDTTKCSNRYKKQRLYVSKLQRRIANIRKDYTHKVSSLLIRHYQYLSLESLRVQNMMKNHKLAKAIADVGFFAFKTQLLYKAQYNHRVVFEADTFFPSSKLCSNCGAIHKHLTLADRTYVCPSCGFTIDRDINAAINLKEKMKQTLIGGVTAEFMRVDPHRLNEDLAINQVKAMAYEARI